MPKSCLWAAVVKRAQGRANSSTGRKRLRVESLVRGELVEQIAAWFLRMPGTVGLQTHAVIAGVCNVGNGTRHLIAIVTDIHDPSAVRGWDLLAFVVRGRRSEWRVG